MLWSDNRALGTGRQQRTRRSGCRRGVDTRPYGRWRTAPGAPTTRCGIVRLGSGRYGCIGWTWQSGRLGGRPRYRAGIAAICSWRAAGRATAAVRVRPWARASVLAAGARSKTYGVPGVPVTGSGPTGQNVRPGQSTPTSWQHTRHTTARPLTFSHLFTPLITLWTHSAAESVWLGVKILTVDTFRGKVDT